MLASTKLSAFRFPFCFLFKFPVTASRELAGSLTLPLYSLFLQSQFSLQECQFPPSGLSFLSFRRVLPLFFFSKLDHPIFLTLVSGLAIGGFDPGLFSSPTVNSPPLPFLLNARALLYPNSRVFSLCPSKNPLRSALFSEYTSWTLNAGCTPPILPSKERTLSILPPPNCCYSACFLTNPNYIRFRSHFLPLVLIPISPLGFTVPISVWPSFSLPLSIQCFLLCIILGLLSFFFLCASFPSPAPPYMACIITVLTANPSVGQGFSSPFPCAPPYFF